MKSSELGTYHNEAFINTLFASFSTGGKLSEDILFFHISKLSMLVNLKFSVCFLILFYYISVRFVIYCVGKPFESC